MGSNRSFTIRPAVAATYAGGAATAAAGAWLVNISPLLPWALLLSGVLAYLVIARPQTFVLVLIAILPWQGALRFPTENLTVVKLVGALLFVSVCMSTLISDRRLKLTPVIWCALLLCVTVTLSMVVNNPDRISVTETLRYWTLTLFVFLIVQLLDDRDAFLRALRVLAVSAIIGAAWASVQFLSGSVQRAAGPINDPNEFAYFLAAIVPFVAYLYMAEPQRRRWWGLGLLCLALGILGSSSRGAFVALGVAAVWAVLARRVAPRVVLASLTAVALSATVALALSTAATSQNLHNRSNDLGSSVDLRKSYWSAAERIALNHPVFGIGPARFQVVGPTYVRNTPVLETHIAVNNTYLTMISENGALATLAFLVLLAAIWRQILLATARASTRERSAFQAAFIIALVGGIFFSAQLSTPFWLIAALISAYARVPARS